MKLQTGATQVATRTAQLMQATRVGGRGEKVAAIQEPIWFRSVLSHPPTHDLLPRVRQLEKFQNATDSEEDSLFFKTRTAHKFSTNPKHLYRLEKLQFKEDEIRNLFYSQHPWELARPRSMVEQDGETAIERDWSTMEQQGLALTGESVVQRTLYLLEQPEFKDKLHEAYTQASFEFFRLRIREQAENDVANEEALMFGAVIDETAISHGIAREQEVIDKYVDDVLEASKALQGPQGPVVAREVEEQPTFDQ